jgi:hypothetical protein
MSPNQVAGNPPPLFSLMSSQAAHYVFVESPQPKKIRHLQLLKPTWNYWTHFVPKLVTPFQLLVLDIPCVDMFT